MPKIAGSFNGKANWQTTIQQADSNDHIVSVVEIAGQQKSSDPNWNNAKVKYVGLTDLIGGQGRQTGYFTNEHTDGSCDRGSFEARVTTTGNLMTLEGTFTITGGTGKYNGATGGGTFRSRSTSPNEVECTWDGTYQTVEAKRTGGA